MGGRGGREEESARDGRGRGGEETHGQRRRGEGGGERDTHRDGERDTNTDRQRQTDRRQTDGDCKESNINVQREKIDHDKHSREGDEMKTRRVFL